MIFDVDDEVVLEPATGVVEHRDEDLLTLLLVQSAKSGLAQHADAFIVTQVHFLGSV
jgi:hypothetical protein